MIRPDQYNYESNVLGAWTGPGTSTTEPKASSGGYNYLPSDHFIQDGSFLRIRDLILGYSIPSKITKKAYIQKLRIYVKADNLLTWTNIRVTPLKLEVPIPFPAGLILVPIQQHLFIQ